VAAAACVSGPTTSVVLDNDYPPSSGYVVYRAYWGSVSFSDPVFPGSSSEVKDTIPASTNTAYVVLAPRWDPDAGSPPTPTSFLLLQSIDGFGLRLGDTLHITVDDADFAGNCAVGSHLSQAQADFITQFVLPDVFPDAAPSLQYDPALCTMSVAP
jgi:hypothetical protein